MERVKESGELLVGTMAGSIHMNGQVLSGLNAPVTDTEPATKGYTLELVRKVAPQNLLDNSDFTNPVNQRGVISGSLVPGDTYFLDRWYTSYEADAYPTFDTSGIGNLTHDILQKMDLHRYVGKSVTIVLYSDTGTPIHCASGIVTNQADWNSIALTANWECSICNANIGQWYVGVRSSCKYVALYPGEYTLDTVPNYHPKGYAAELAECQRYFHRYTVPA